MKKDKADMCECGGKIEVIITTGTAYTISCKKCVAGVTFKTKRQAEKAWEASYEER